MGKAAEAGAAAILLGATAVIGIYIIVSSKKQQIGIVSLAVAVHEEKWVKK